MRGAALVADIRLSGKLRVVAWAGLLVSSGKMTHKITHDVVCNAQIARAILVFQ
jgi:hypothetical protein